MNIYLLRVYSDRFTKSIEIRLIMNAKKEIKKLINEIIQLGAVLPGCVGKVYTVCGKKTCKCKDPVNPQKHGPYNLLSFTIAKKNSTKFIKDKDLAAVLLMQKKYKRLKAICQELPLAYLQLIKGEGVMTAVSFAEMLKQILDSETLSEQRLLYRINELEKTLSQWREKAIERTQANNTLKSRVKQLEKSRDSWKERARKAEKNRQTINLTTSKKSRKKK